MNHRAGVGMGQRLGNLQGIADRLGQRQRPFLLDQATHVHAFDKLENNEMQSPVFAHEERPGDVIVIEPGSRLGLVLETLQRVRIGRLFGGRIFRATVRPRWVSMARKTRPIPPPPTYSTNSNCPRSVARHHATFEDPAGRVRHGRRGNRRAAGDDRRFVGQRTMRPLRRRRGSVGENLSPFAGGRSSFDAAAFGGSFAHRSPWPVLQSFVNATVQRVALQAARTPARATTISRRTPDAEEKACPTKHLL